MNIERFFRHFMGCAAIVLIGFLVMRWSTPLAVKLDEPHVAAFGLFAGMTLIGLGLLEVTRIVLWPYLDLKKYVLQAYEDGDSGEVVIGVSIVLAALILAYSSAARADVPPGAYAYLPMLKREMTQYWPADPLPHLMAADVEQETCIPLRGGGWSRGCWNPHATLKTSREEGVGLGMITRTDRFDALEEIVAAHPAELRGWSWESSNLYDPALQLRALVLKHRGNYERVIGMRTELDRQALMFCAYNGGLGGCNADRKRCAAMPGCDPNTWFGNVERASTASKVAAAGYKKSFAEIRREYVHNVLKLRGPRYLKPYEDA